MTYILKWSENNPTKTGEVLTKKDIGRVVGTRNKLLKMFPKAEQAFCRVIDKMVNRLPKKWKKILWYTRQKWFVVSPHVVFFGDFYFRNLRLLIEIDGPSHLKKHTDEMDLWRSKLISIFRNNRTLRFTNAEILEGDFREVETKFVEGCGRSDLSEAYLKMKKDHPVLYQDSRVLLTYKK